MPAAPASQPPFDWIGDHSQTTQRSTATHGHKRRASDELDQNSAISSHFKKLRINHAPLPSRPVGISFRTPTETSHTHTHTATSPSPCRESHVSNDADYMPVDETPHRIVIHDLEAEIAAIEEEEEEASRTMFLPDVEKKVSAIPQKLLQDREERADGNTQALVLYHDPASLSVPAEEDAVRKTIAAARARVREKQAHEREMAPSMIDGNAHMQHYQHHHPPRLDEYDPDAMEIE